MFVQGPHASYCGRQGGERKGQRDKMQDLIMSPLIGECLSQQYGISQYFQSSLMEKLKRMGAAGEASLSRQHAVVSQKMNSSGCWRYRGDQEIVPVIKELPFWWREIDQKCYYDY